MSEAADLQILSTELSIRGQFEMASSGRLEARLASGVSASARQAARAALSGSDPTGGAKYFKLASSGHAGTVVA